MAITYKRLLQREEDGYICDPECLIMMNGRWRFDTAVTRLQQRINLIIKQIEGNVGEVERFYIGKTYVDALDDQLVRGDPQTWDTRGINNCWNREQYNNLIVLTVVTWDLPNVRNPEDYTLKLENQLIFHYKQERDGRLANQGDNQGPPGENRHDGYVLYLEVQLRRRARARLPSFSLPV